MSISTVATGFWRNRWARLGLAALAVVAVVVAALVLVADDPAGAQDNVAIAVNTKDGTSEFRVKLKIQRDNGEVVESSNAAVAYASCTDCQTVAVAMQVLFVDNDAEEISPTNLALAVNEGCTNCDTLASAYQYVYGTDGPVHFTPEGLRRIHEIKKRLKELRKSDASTEEIQAELDRLAEDLAHVLASEVVVNDKQLQEVPPPAWATEGADGTVCDDGTTQSTDATDPTAPCTTTTTSGSEATTTTSTEPPSTSTEPTSTSTSVP